MLPLSSLSLLLLALVAVNADIQVIPGYPPIDQVPETNSPQVQAWLKKIDLTRAPKIPLGEGDPPLCPPAPFPGRCNWICDQCPANDLVNCRSRNTWAITFDDGPHVVTPTLLDFLKTERISASFFLVGSHVVQRPDTVRRQIAEGHHIASHTWSHRGLTTLTNEQIVAEMKWTEKAVLEVTGRRLKYVRPPYGDIDNRVRFVLKKLGYTVVNWSGDDFGTDDWKLPDDITETEIVDKFTESLDKYIAGSRSKGIISLEHDFDVPMIDLARKLVPLGRARNITITSVAGCQRDHYPYQRVHHH
ncbi:chitin deacetylase [Mortierella polycephala]|uniref:Chitin deacetylase n=1 Tax=Mortierella polycephala TaxID=41804 RepID=A0A9P6QFY7_9FUNG|nr:chitin deacetylase [Mortierella polycephala]